MAKLVCAAVPGCTGYFWWKDCTAQQLYLQVQSSNADLQKFVQAVYGPTMSGNPSPYDLYLDYYNKIFYNAGNSATKECVRTELLRFIENSYSATAMWKTVKTLVNLIPQKTLLTPTAIGKLVTSGFDQLVQSLMQSGALVSMFNAASCS